ncbi:meiosis-specific nuclear structural protein 1-like [Xenia sp. Carnegie-2017]|uniref:meiosis-specific nuclear structural protein 1-like n=1 Tax=Xenia sp. Carnegie-2017 TaxID=2897299 RepID=UPI001F040B21|nr:meiosis-specific nuclear structural protein 1-like [Xenia sp. Carnegie-2017]
MEKVKERIRLLKDKIEDAEQREADDALATKELEAKIDILGGEKTTLLSRINVVKADLLKVKNQLDEKETKLDDALARNENSEIRVKELADTEVDGYERSDKIESTLKEAAINKERADHMLVEAERKSILEQELVRIEEKYEKEQERGDELKKTLDGYTDQMRDLEEKDRDASEREDVSEDRMKFLESQIRVTLSSAESHEREAVKLENLNATLNDEVKSFKEKYENVLREMDEGMEDLINDD